MRTYVNIVPYCRRRSFVGPNTQELTNVYVIPDNRTAIYHDPHTMSYVKSIPDFCTRRDLNAILQTEVVM